jgi:adenosylcobinamide-GDP ribazoletransferase
MTAFVRHYLLALQFFTRLPVTGRLAHWVGYSPQMLRASAAHLPGIGWLVGASAAAILLVLLAVLPELPARAWVAVVVSTICSVLLTGAFHEDGLADLADGLGGSLEPARALEIMKDSRIGSFGALALLLAMLAKVGLLTMLVQWQPAMAAAALFGGHVCSRFAPLVIVRKLRHVGQAGSKSKSKPMADQISVAALTVAALWCVGALVVLAASGFPLIGGACALVGVGLGLVMMWRLLKRRLGGFTGDALGTTQQVCEIGFYLGVLLALPGQVG